MLFLVIEFWAVAVAVGRQVVRPPGFGGRLKFFVGPTYC